MFISDSAASAHATRDPAAPLAPSELIYLNGGQFAGKARINNIELFSGEKVAADQLGEAMMAAAFLANEAVGAMRLEVRQKKALFGLRKVDALYAEPVAVAEWPEGSLEAQMGSIAAQLVGGNKPRNEVSTILFQWMEEDAPAPWLWAAQLVREAMARRGMLETVSEKKLKVFNTTRHVLPESTATLAKEMPAAPVQTLLEACKETRPEVWKLLTKEIKSAMKRRTEAADHDMDFD